MAEEQLVVGGKRAVSYADRALAFLNGKRGLSNEIKDYRVTQRHGKKVGRFFKKPKWVGSAQA